MMVDVLSFNLPNSPDTMTFYLYAVNEEDARKMAQALIELCDSKGRARLEQIKKELEDTRKLIPETEKKISEVENRFKEESAECEEMRKVIPYRNAADALQDMIDLDKSLRMIQVEMVGIQAKVDAIKKFKETSGMSDMATRMLVTEDIELAGVLARKAGGVMMTVALDVPKADEAGERQILLQGDPRLCGEVFARHESR